MNTFKRDVLPVIVAVLAASVVSAIWYSPLLFGRQWIALRSQWMHIPPNPHIASWKPFAELMRETLVAYVLSRLVKRQAIDRLTHALSLGFWVWLGFPITMLVGASLWDNKPWVLSLIHGGDWFTKMLVMTAVIMFTRRLAPTAGAPPLMESEPPNQWFRSTRMDC
jgi:Protein of unknown function (DUF1761)